VTSTNVERFAAFAYHVGDTSLPREVLEETKRLVLDGLGCGLAATTSEFGKVGVEYGRILGAQGDEATILGQRQRTSVHGAAFANTELISALDLTAITLPGHVVPYIVPLTLALGEARHQPGARLLAASAACLEMCFRLSKSMEDLRDVQDGVPATPRVFGYASMVFGLSAAASVMKELDQTTTTEALGIAGGTSPVNALRPWQMHIPSTTVKYGLGAGIVLSALTAAYLAEFGHRGDTLMLDDEEFGYPGLVGSRKWEPSGLTDRLGEEWRFPRAISFKPYATTRTMHATLDALIEVITKNDIKHDEIESIVAYGESWSANVPVYVNRDVRKPYDAQFSFAHAVAVAAHGVRPGKDWQTPDTVFRESVIGLMPRIEWRPHPLWGTAVTGDPLARPARAEVTARGETFSADRSYPKGTSSPDPATYTTTDELVEKFLHNADGVLAADAADQIVELVLDLDHVDDVATLTQHLRP
jgi:2-methylcitrate dehydratase PrpD